MPLPSWHASSCARRRRCCGRRLLQPRLWKVGPPSTRVVQSVAVLRCCRARRGWRSILGPDGERLASADLHAGGAEMLIPCVAGAWGLLEPQIAGLLPPKQLQRGAGNWLDTFAAAETAGVNGKQSLLALLPPWTRAAPRCLERALFSGGGQGRVCRGLACRLPAKLAATSRCPRCEMRSMRCTKPLQQVLPSCALQSSSSWSHCCPLCSTPASARECSGPWSRSWQRRRAGRPRRFTHAAGASFSTPAASRPR